MDDCKIQPSDSVVFSSKVDTDTNRGMIDDDVVLVGAEFKFEVRAVIESAVALAGEAGADVLQDAGENEIVFGVKGVEAEALCKGEESS